MTKHETKLSAKAKSAAKCHYHPCSTLERNLSPAAANRITRTEKARRYPLMLPADNVAAGLILLAKRLSNTESDFACLPCRFISLRLAHDIDTTVQQSSEGETLVSQKMLF